MTISAAPSPAWLGFFAALSFAALVVVSFASGYHLVGAPGHAAASGASSAAAQRTGIVRDGLTPDRAVLRQSPDAASSIVARLPSGIAVGVLSEQGEWAMIRYERQGETQAGWTLKSNLSLR